MRVSYNNIFTDHFKTNSLTINFLMPLDEASATCCAMLAQILRRGCGKYGEMDRIAARLEELYGASVEISSDKVGENLSFTVQASFLDDRFALDGEDIRLCTIDVMADMLFCPLLENGVFRNDFFEQEKQNLADYIKGQINDKRTYSMIRCTEIMFADEPYRFASCGSLQYLETLDAQALYAFYRNMLSAASILVTYVGRQTDVENLVRTCFAPLLVGTSGALCKPRLSKSVTEKTVREVFDVVQGKLCLGYRFTEAVDYYAARLFNVIFGGSPTSKLFMNVRETLSLCYYCSSRLDPFVNSLFISSGIEFDKFEMARDEIFRQLADMQNGNITDEEFENGKLYLLDYIRGIQDSPAQLVADAVHRHLLNCEDEISVQADKIRALTKEDIVVAARKLHLDTVYFLHGKEDKQ